MVNLTQASFEDLRLQVHMAGGCLRPIWSPKFVESTDSLISFDLSHLDFPPNCGNPNVKVEQTIIKPSGQGVTQVSPNELHMAMQDDARRIGAVHG